MSESMTHLVSCHREALDCNLLLKVCVPICTKANQLRASYDVGEILNMWISRWKKIYTNWSH